MRERAFVLLAQLNTQAPNKVTADVDRLSDDFAEVVSGLSSPMSCRAPASIFTSVKYPAYVIALKHLTESRNDSFIGVRQT